MSPKTQEGTLTKLDSVSAFRAVRALESRDWRVLIHLELSVRAAGFPSDSSVLGFRKHPCGPVLTSENTLTWGLRLPPAQLIAPVDAAASAPRRREPAPACTAFSRAQLWCVQAVTVLLGFHCSFC